MPVYTIAYDLVNEQDGHDYEPLWKELKRLDAHRTQLSLWLINLNNTVAEAHDHFKKYLDKDDRLMVSRLRANPGNYAFSNAMNGTNDWLKKNPPT